MKIVVFFYFLIAEYSLATSLYEKCKADADNNPNSICKKISVSSLIQEKNSNLISLKKDIWETTNEFNNRKKTLEKTLEQKIIQEIYQESRENGSGKVTMKSYDADNNLMKLTLEWNSKIKNIFSSKELPKSVTLNINRVDGKRVFDKKRTHRFDISVKYISHNLKISKIYIKSGKKEYKLLSPSKWFSPTKSQCKGGKINKGFCQTTWKNAKKICSAIGMRLPTREELRVEVSKCGGEMITYGDSNFDSITDKNGANKSYQSCYKENGFNSSYYWSSTTNASSTSDAWVVYFYNGGDGNSDRSVSRFVRCVRGGQ